MLKLIETWLDGNEVVLLWIVQIIMNIHWNQIRCWYKSSPKSAPIRWHWMTFRSNDLECPRVRGRKQRQHCSPIMLSENKMKENKAKRISEASFQWLGYLELNAWFYTGLPNHGQSNTSQLSYLFVLWVADCAWQHPLPSESKWHVLLAFSSNWTSSLIYLIRSIVPVNDGDHTLI